LADMAVAGDGHTPYFENTPWEFTLALAPALSPRRG